MSGQVHVISDLHFSHENMALNRGFETIEQHDELIIQRWNAKVDKGDVVWILGDLTMERAAYYPLLDRLKGIKNVVLGNHDRRQDVPALLRHVNSVCSMAKVKGFMLTHCPIHTCEINRFTKNIHGHLHEKFVRNWIGMKDSRYVNVSAEVIDYTPVLLSSL